MGSKKELLPGKFEDFFLMIQLIEGHKPGVITV
jgi:hypothetical protein